MIKLGNIRSFSDFQRNAKSHIRRLKKTGKPEVLTLNGKAELVVQDAASYQRLLDELDLAQSIQAVKKAIAEADRGEGRPAKEFLRELAAKAGFDLDEDDGDE